MHTLVIRAEKVKLAEQHAAEPGLNVLDGRVTAVDYQGQFARYFVAVGSLSFQAINPIAQSPFPEGTKVQLAFAADDCVLMADEGPERE
jgi:putative spermidine/putrescine transport system ATP-binding protein/spermidine/putrescine transport system ATP-binding protein